MQKIKCVEREGYVTYYESKDFVTIPCTYEEKDCETRGVWVSTVANIDINPSDNEESFKKQIDSIIEVCKKYHFNTIIFQVRPGCDALYASKINPMSSVLSLNKIEDDVEFDIFDYLIKKAKEVDIEVHAWINPYRVRGARISEEGLTKEQFIKKYLSKRNFAYLHPECVVVTGEDKLLLDPASDVVQTYLQETVLEIATKYDIKAIHIDDYFYPYEKFVDPDEEEKRLKKYPNLSIPDFRRQNVNDMIYKIHQTLKSLDKRIEFGISPFSVYRTSKKSFEMFNKEGGYIKGSNNHYSCLEGYESLYADVYLWMKNGWIDYVVPQIYFPFDNFKKNEDGTYTDILKYADLVKWWSEVSEETNVKCYIGLALYRYKDEGAWANKYEIINQIKYNKQYPAISGEVMFTFSDLVRNNCESIKGAREELSKIWTKDVKPF